MDPSTWHWPQWTWLVVAVVDVAYVLGKHGQRRENYNFFISAIGTGILFFLMLKGGFFK